MKKNIRNYELAIYIIMIVTFCFIFSIGINALFFSKYMLKTLNGPVTNELLLLNQYFGLALTFAAVLLFICLREMNDPTYLILVIFFFFFVNLVFINTSLVQKSLGSFLTFYQIIIYSFNILYFLMFFYAQNKYPLKRNNRSQLKRKKS